MISSRSTKHQHFSKPYRPGHIGLARPCWKGPVSGKLNCWIRLNPTESCGFLNHFPRFTLLSLPVVSWSMFHWFTVGPCDVRDHLFTFHNVFPVIQHSFDLLNKLNFHSELWIYQRIVPISSSNQSWFAWKPQFSSMLFPAIYLSIYLSVYLSIYL